MLKGLPFFPLLVVAAVMTPAAPAQAQYEKIICSNDARSFAPEAVINACNVVIGSAKEAHWLPIYYNKRGDAYRDKGEYDRAIADYTKVIEFEPREFSAYYNRGRAYGAKGEHGRAIVDYTKTIELLQFADAYYNRGLAYGATGERDRAIADQRKALDLDPAHKGTKDALAKLGVSP